MDVMRPWIAEILGSKDEVLINFIYGLIKEKLVNGKEIQISLTRFMEKNTRKFMKELWTHLLSAQENAKKEGREPDQERTRRTRDKEDNGYDHERVKVDREVDNVKAATLEPHSKRQTKFSSKWKVTDEKNGSRLPLRRRSRSPIQRRSRSPIQRRSRSPIRRRSRSPICQRSQSPIGRRSRSLIRRTVKESSRKGQNRIKTGPKREACRSREKSEAVTVDRARKTEENAKRMAVNPGTVKKLFKFKRKKKRQGP
nr:serine/arginine repetitive matrix protein 1 isoform X1 [Tanacetum cinerariifolium]